MSWAAVAALLGLGAASFAAATPLPMTSEPLFVGLLFSDLLLPWVVVMVASFTNAAGSICTYLVARAGSARYLPISAKWRLRLQGWYDRWGLWSLIFSWIPGGDLLVVLAGFARAPLLPVALILTVAKTVRFAALAALTLGLLGTWGG